MDPATGKKAKRHSFSSIDTPKYDQQQARRSRSSAPATMLPIALSAPEAPVTVSAGLNIAEHQGLPQTLSSKIEESPEPEILFVRSAPHAKRQMAAGTSPSRSSVQSISSQIVSQQRRLQCKRTFEHSADEVSKRVKLPTTASGALATQGPQTTPVTPSSSSQNQGTKLARPSNHSLQQSLTSRVSEPTSPQPSSTFSRAVTGTELDSLQDHGKHESLNRGKRWTARNWTARHYHDLADMAVRAFPFAEYMRKHSKTEKEVREVFSGVVMVPLLQHAQRGIGLARGGLGEKRMRQYREMEKETMETIRAEAQQGRREEEAEDRRKHERPKKEPLCADCKAKHIPGKPTTMAEAQEAMIIARRQFTQAMKVYDSFADKAAKAAETSTHLRRHVPTAAPAAGK